MQQTAVGKPAVPEGFVCLPMSYFTQLQNNQLRVNDQLPNEEVAVNDDPSMEMEEENRIPVVEDEQIDERSMNDQPAFCTHRLLPRDVAKIILSSTDPEILCAQLPSTPVIGAMYSNFSLKAAAVGHEGKTWSADLNHDNLRPWTSHQHSSSQLIHFSSRNGNWIRLKNAEHADVKRTICVRRMYNGKFDGMKKTVFFEVFNGNTKRVAPDSTVVITYENGCSNFEEIFATHEPPVRISMIAKDVVIKSSKFNRLPVEKIRQITTAELPGVELNLQQIQNIQRGVQRDRGTGGGRFPLENVEKLRQYLRDGLIIHFQAVPLFEVMICPSWTIEILMKESFILNESITAMRAEIDVLDVDPDRSWTKTVQLSEKFTLQMQVEVDTCFKIGRRYLTLLCCTTPSFTNRDGNPVSVIIAGMFHDKKETSSYISFLSKIQEQTLKENTRLSRDFSVPTVVSDQCPALTAALCSSKVFGEMSFHYSCTAHLSRNCVKNTKGTIPFRKMMSSKLFGSAYPSSPEAPISRKAGIIDEWNEEDCEEAVKKKLVDKRFNQSMFEWYNHPDTKRAILASTMKRRLYGGLGVRLPTTNRLESINRRMKIHLVCARTTSEAVPLLYDYMNLFAARMVKSVFSEGDLLYKNAVLKIDWDMMTEEAQHRLLRKAGLAEASAVVFPHRSAVETIRKGLFLSHSHVTKMVRDSVKYKCVVTKGMGVCVVVEAHKMFRVSKDLKCGENKCPRFCRHGAALLLSMQENEANRLAEDIVKCRSEAHEILLLTGVEAVGGRKNGRKRRAGGEESRRRRNHNIFNISAGSSAVLDGSTVARQVDVSEMNDYEQSFNISAGSSAVLDGSTVARQVDVSEMNDYEQSFNISAGSSAVLDGSTVARQVDVSEMNDYEQSFNISAGSSAVLDGSTVARQVDVSEMNDYEQSFNISAGSSAVLDGSTVASFDPNLSVGEFLKKAMFGLNSPSRGEVFADQSNMRGKFGASSQNSRTRPPLLVDYSFGLDSDQDNSIIENIFGQTNVTEESAPSSISSDDSMQYGDRWKVALKEDPTGGNRFFDL